MDNSRASNEAVRRAILSDENGKSLFFRNVDWYDNLWILQFVLSHKGNTTKVCKTALHTLRFREKMKLKVKEKGDIRHQIRNVCAEPGSFGCDFEKDPLYEKFNEYSGRNCVIITQLDLDRGAILYIYYKGGVANPVGRQDPNGQGPREREDVSGH